MATDDASLLRLLKLLGREGQPIRLVRGDATEVKAVELGAEHITEALKVAEQERWNLWFEVQPSSFNRPYGRSKASDITRLAALYVDIDYKAKPHGMGGRPEAGDLLQDIIGAIGSHPSCVVHTGNGMHPYWPVADGQITEDNRNRIAGLLKRWGVLVRQLAQAHHGSIDNVYDLPRILRVPGSTNFKNPDKPIPTVVDFTDGVAPLTLDEIERVLDDYEIPDIDVEVAGEILSPVTMWEWADSDCEFAGIARSEIASSQPAARHPWALKYAAILHGMIRNGCVTEATFYELRALLDAKFRELCATQEPVRNVADDEVRAIMRWGQGQAESMSDLKLADDLRQHLHGEFLLGFQPDVSQGTSAATKLYSSIDNVTSIFTGQPVDPMTPITDGNLALAVDLRLAEQMGNAARTDTGNSARLAQQLRGRYIYVPAMGWHYWDGTRYVLDTVGGVTEQAKDLFMTMLMNAREPDAAKWAQQSLNRARISAAVDLCRSVPNLVVDTLTLDAKGFELCTPDGIVELHSGRMREADPLIDFHTLSTAYAPDAAHPTPKWGQLLRDAIGDEERISYLQRLFGAAAIGKLIWHIMPIFIGPGGSGKTSILEVMGGVLGQYTAVMPPKSLVESRSEQHPTVIAQLRGVRLAIHSEVPPNSRFDETLVKIFTGESRLRGRYMNKDFFTFENTATHFVGVNHLPEVQVGGTGFWRRMRNIVFRNARPLASQNPFLVKEILTEEGPGVMAWVVEGARQVLLAGLQDPQEVLAATQVYRLEEDAIARYLEEEVISVTGFECSRELVYLNYRSWCTRQGTDALSFPKFAREVTQSLPDTNLGTRGVFTNLVMRVAAETREGSL